MTVIMIIQIRGHNLHHSITQDNVETTYGMVHSRWLILDRCRVVRIDYKLLPFLAKVAIWAFEGTWFCFETARRGSLRHSILAGLR